jgi:hypothetical protein
VARFERMRDRLPTLYRPDEDDPGLLPPILRAVANVLEEMNREAGDALQAHWFEYADSALYDAYFIRSRQLLDLPYPAPDAPEVTEFPHIHDLARLASLLALPPWQEPPALRETVEEYRQRIERIVALYRNGLGTVYALRSMVEAQLPVDLAGSPEERDRPFWLEEFAPLVADSLAVQARGEPVDMVGPLMRWTVTNDGLEAATPTLYISGVEPQEGSIDATTSPLVELYRYGEEMPRLGIAYRDTVGPNLTLRLRPAYSSWIGLDDGIQRSEALPAETHPADPTAPGPWQAVTGAPEGTVVDIRQTHDRTLWVAANTDAGGTLHRFDGQEWSAALTGLPELRCLAEDGQDLLIGTNSGLLRMPLYPETAGDFTASPVPDVGAVHALFRTADGLWWLGTDDGVARLGADGASFFGLGEDEGAATEVFAISQDRSGTLYVGTQLGLFQYQPETDHWYWYEGEEHTEQEPDWEQFLPGEEGEARNFPEEQRVFLPPVRCVHRGPDTSLWIGTDNGIARYVARSTRGRAYTTLLEAFPDLTTGRVFAIEEDTRGIIWFCTETGLIRYDGRDLCQFQDGEWVRLGRVDPSDEDDVEHRAWRFNRSSSQWQHFDPGTPDWVPSAGEVRTVEQAAVRALAWTDQAAADLGEWDGTRFTNSTVVNSTDLLVRYKPTEERILTGGIPAIPRLPVGSSEWRYLSLEPEDLVEPEDRPSWTIEGRLLPPPDGEAPEEGRYDLPSGFDGAVFAFNPAARVTYNWEPRRPMTVLARLKQLSANDHIDPAIIDRVWQGIQQVRPAGVRAALAVEEEVVRGGSDG